VEVEVEVPEMKLRMTVGYTQEVEEGKNESDECWR
jgi:hypothetical protein